MEGLHKSQFILCSQQLLSNVNVAVCDTKASLSTEKPQEQPRSSSLSSFTHIFRFFLIGHYSIKSLSSLSVCHCEKHILHMIQPVT